MKITLSECKSFIFRPKGAYGVPIQYERSFRWKLGQFRYLCQSNALPGHVKVTVSRENLFEDSFAQVRDFKEKQCHSSRKHNVLFFFFFFL